MTLEVGSAAAAKSGGDVITFVTKPDDIGRPGVHDPGGSTAMLIVHVHVKVKPESIDSFRQATIENARRSVKEPGIARFDIIQQSDDPARFVLVEVYRSDEAPARHKETSHYLKWRDAVANMMAEPRTSVKYQNQFPDNNGW